MPKLSTLFKNCNEMEYDETGLDVNYKFVECGETLYIYFQGSNSKWDWFFNFFFFKKPYEDFGMKVHRGFATCYEQVKDTIRKKILQKKKNGKYAYQFIYIIGYSHGGALSGLCYEDCWYHRKDLWESGCLIGYGFESPRFLWHGKEYQYIWKNYFVIENAWDLVVHCPPKLFGFREVGKHIAIGKGKKIGIIKAHTPDEVYKSLLEYESGIVQ